MSLGDLYPHLVEQWDERNDKTPFEYAPMSNKKVWWKCQHGHSWQAIIASRTRMDRKCKECFDNQKRTMDNQRLKFAEHGARLYRIWSNMKYRCNNSNSKDYHNYGGRGITICDEWQVSFAAFYNWAVSNGYSSELQVDRENNNGNYEPSNCRWATLSQQASNRRSRKRA